jgi:hypothetical protein
MEDTHSGTIGTKTTQVGSSAPALMDEDSLRTLSFVNNQIPIQHKQSKKPPINQSVVWDHFKKVEPIDKDNPKAVHLLQ